MGDRAGATTTYERLMAVWKDADGDLPQMKAARAWLAERGGN